MNKDQGSLALFDAMDKFDLIIYISSVLREVIISVFSSSKTSL
ncbi:hypothetical protein BH18THE2_BH18THE2_02280 [soil metagenome]